MAVRLALPELQSVVLSPRVCASDPQALPTAQQSGPLSGPGLCSVTGQVQGRWEPGASPAGKKLSQSKRTRVPLRIHGIFQTGEVGRSR